MPRKKAVTKKKVQYTHSNLKSQAVQSAYKKLRPGQQVLVNALAEDLTEKMRLRVGRSVQLFANKKAGIEVIGKIGMLLAQAEKAAA